MAGAPTWVVEYNSYGALVLNCLPLPFQEIFQFTEHVWLLVFNDLKELENLHPQIHLLLSHLTFQRENLMFCFQNGKLIMIIWSISHLRSIPKIADRNKVLFLLKF